MRVRACVCSGLEPVDTGYAGAGAADASSMADIDLAAAPR